MSRCAPDSGLSIPVVQAWSSNICFFPSEWIGQALLLQDVPETDNHRQAIWRSLSSNPERQTSCKETLLATNRLHSPFTSCPQIGIAGYRGQLEDELLLIRMRIPFVHTRKETGTSREFKLQSSFDTPSSIDFHSSKLKEEK
ncbi:hypothetical protein M9H77_13302 [Catharanthus roseus]|uniref:Uncharacterized protein n=1 Tax=Catharanthus roseus TaxID=4058 RepID=A0ACC0BK18_CATRO|nr:hypothetical protein M9H77_13302 [Catharanthus roseus]